ncbi:hypothetical protein MRY82_07300 [bacterium]|nr:hypothetical protein [bacterium]
MNPARLPVPPPRQVKNGLYLFFLTKARNNWLVIKSILLSHIDAPKERASLKLLLHAIESMFLIKEKLYMPVKKIKLLFLTVLLSTTAFAQSPAVALKELDINPDILPEIEKHLTALSEQATYKKDDLFGRFQKMNASLSAYFDVSQLSVEELKVTISNISETLPLNKNLSSFKGKLSSTTQNNERERTTYINHAIYLGLMGKCVKAYASKALGYNLSDRFTVGRFILAISTSNSDDYTFIKTYFDNLSFLLNDVFEVDYVYQTDLVVQM